jgi:hypothetical protein
MSISDTSARAKDNQSIVSQSFVDSSIEESKSGSSQSRGGNQGLNGISVSGIDQNTMFSMPGNSADLGQSFAAGSSGGPLLSLISPDDETIDTPSFIPTADDHLGLRDYQLDIYR